MFKRLTVAVAALSVLATQAFAAGTVPGFSVTPQFDKSGKLAPGCKLYIIQAGTVSSPQNAYQDTALTLLQPNPMTCDATGRLPQWFVADGNIKLRLTDKNGVELFVQDNLLVIGPSGGGGGGGGSVDPTTILQTGWMQAIYGTGTVTGFVRANGRTIGNASSGATERANADTSALFSFLWNGDPNLAVSGGRGVSAAADYAANKTIALPDWRGRALAFLDDMGNSAAGRLSSTYFGTSATVLGASGGTESRSLVTANLPPYTPAGTISSILNNNGIIGFTSPGGNVGFGGVATGGNSTPLFGNQGVSSAFTGTAQGGSSAGFPVIQPTMLATIYLKL